MSAILIPVLFMAAFGALSWALSAWGQRRLKTLNEKALLSPRGE
jgi:hypothetical protein